MKKRGQLVLKPLIEMTIAIFVLLSFFAVAREFGTQDIFVKARIAREGALLGNTFYDANGQVWVKYPSNVSEYIIDLQQRSFRTSSVVNDPIERGHEFVPITTTINKLVNPDRLILSKDGEVFSISRSVPELRKLQCGKASFKNKRVQIEIDDSSLQPIVDIVGFQLQGLGCVGCTERYSSIENEDVFVKIEKKKTSEFTASFYFDSDKLEESKQLACAFLNNILDSYGDVRVYLLPTAELQSKKDKIAINIELGDIDARKIGDSLLKTLT